MSEDESIVLVICAVISLIIWSRWYYLLGSTIERRVRGFLRPWLAVTPLLCLAGIFVTLKLAASFDVRDSATYLTFYVVFGAAWVGVALSFLKYIGIHPRDDAIERDNPAAVVAVISSMFALAACYSGANIGDGPGWWCVLFAGLLATVAWFVILGLFQAFCNIAESITVERDVSAGIRFAGLSLGIGIVCGRAAGGDWTSARQTVVEFEVAWPALIVLAVACAVEWSSSSDPGEAPRALAQDDFSIGSVLWAAFYVALSVVAVILLPSLPDNPIYSR